METMRLVLQAAWKVLYIGLILGAGMPIVFALGVRALSGREDTVLEDGTVVAHKAAGGGKLLAILCFAAVLVGVAIGIMVIVAAGMGKIVVFDHGFPTLAPKP